MKFSGFAKIALGCMVTANVLCGAEKTVQPSPGKGEKPAQNTVKPRSDRRGNALIWRVFSQLPENERKKMQELQRNNPEQFAAEMRKIAEKYEQQENAWLKEMNSLVRSYRECSDKNERARLKAEISRLEKSRFEKRLQGFEKMIAATKKRVELMEQDLKKRKEHSKEIVEARVEAILSGEIPVGPAFMPPSRKPGPGPRMAYPHKPGPGPRMAHPRKPGPHMPPHFKPGPPPEKAL